MKNEVTRCATGGQEGWMELLRGSAEPHHFFHQGMGTCWYHEMCLLNSPSAWVNGQGSHRHGGWGGGGGRL